MRKILITGMSGTGKSSVIERLGELGYKAVDLDDAYWCEETLVTVMDDPTGTQTEPGHFCREDGAHWLLDTLVPSRDEVVTRVTPAEMTAHR